MNFGIVKQITIPEGSVYQIYSGSTLLWSKSGTGPVPPGPGTRVLYLQNGDDSSSTKQSSWSINTGITWRDIFLNSSSYGLTLPGLETVVEYEYLWVPPEGGLFAGCNPRDNGEGDRDMGGFWRIFGYRGSNFCFDCPSEDDRNFVLSTMDSNTIYTESCQYGYLNSNDLRSYIRVESEGVVIGSSYRDNLFYSWSDASLPHNICLWFDVTQDPDIDDVSARGGVRIYSFTAWTLENGVRHEKIYEGLPYLDSNNVPCIYDTVSGQYQYNCAPSPQPFLYGTI